MQLTTRKNANINLPVVEDIVGGAGEDIVVREATVKLSTCQYINYVSNNPVFIRPTVLS
jgi:hypothetical protein